MLSLNRTSHVDWSGFHSALIHHRVLHGTAEDDEESRRLRHVMALARMAQGHNSSLIINASLSPEQLFEALHFPLPLARSVIYDLRELLEFLLLLDAESPMPHLIFEGEAYWRRVCVAIELASVTFSWRKARRSFNTQVLMRSAS